VWRVGAAVQTTRTPTTKEAKGCMEDGTDSVLVRHVGPLEYCILEGTRMYY
jgi:hypothetical protein